MREVIPLDEYKWRDCDLPAQDLLAARLRAKYYGGEYIILRPYVYNALQWQEDLGRRPETPFNLDQQGWLARYYHDEKNSVAHPQLVDHNKLLHVELYEGDEVIARKFLWCCKRAIDAAVRSTCAFDGVANPHSGQRLRVTNIFGTATA